MVNLNDTRASAMSTKYTNLQLKTVFSVNLPIENWNLLKLRIINQLEIESIYKIIFLNRKMDFPNKKNIFFFTKCTFNNFNWIQKFLFRFLADFTWKTLMNIFFFLFRLTQIGAIQSEISYLRWKLINSKNKMVESVKIRA